MKEYIEREKALEECDWYANEFCECEYAIMPLKGAIENLPAADVRPVVKAKWDDKPVAFFLKCTECGCCVGHRYDVFLDRGELNFCPNCGADMRNAND